MTINTSINTVTPDDVTISEVFHAILTMARMIARDIVDDATTTPKDGENLSRIVLCSEAALEPGKGSKAKGSYHTVRLVWQGEAHTFEQNKADRQRAVKPRDIKVALEGTPDAWSIKPSPKLFDAIRQHRMERFTAQRIAVQERQAREQAMASLNIPKGANVETFTTPMGVFGLNVTHEDITMRYLMEDGTYILQGFNVPTGNIVDPFSLASDIAALVSAAPVVVQAEPQEDEQDEPQADSEPQEPVSEPEQTSEAQEAPQAAPKPRKRRKAQGTRQGKATAQATGKGRKAQPTS